MKNANKKAGIQFISKLSKNHKKDKNSLSLGYITAEYTKTNKCEGQKFKYDLKIIIYLLDWNRNVKILATIGV